MLLPYGAGKEEGQAAKIHFFFFYSFNQISSGVYNFLIDFGTPYGVPLFLFCFELNGLPFYFLKNSVYYDILFKFLFQMIFFCSSKEAEVYTHFMQSNLVAITSLIGCCFIPVNSAMVAWSVCSMAGFQDKIPPKKKNNK